MLGIVGVPYFKPAWIRGQVWPSHKAPDWDGITGMTSSDGFLMVLPIALLPHPSWGNIIANNDPTGAETR
jgi:hypothetical protein